MATRRWICIPGLATLIGRTWRNTASRRAVVGAGAAHGRLLVTSPPYWLALEIAFPAIRAIADGGHVGRVAAGAIAEKYLKEACGVEIVAFTASIGSEFLFPPTAEHPNLSTNPDFLKLVDGIDRETVDSFLPVRAPDTDANSRMEKLVEKYKASQDSIGGTVACVIRNVPTGLGEPCFDKLEAKLAHAMLSIPATKGFEIGSGFGGCQVPGSVHNDPFVKAEYVNGEAGSSKVPRPRLTTKTNNSGGIQGGISNGANIYFHVGFKPAATIGQAQTTTTYDEEEGILEAKGRHDPCVVPRAIPIVEAMAALVIMDAFMAQQARQSARNLLPTP
ncbi:Chorismate synthase [Macrophomina phaseolina MS6]|uniref:chorismate synthase n=1 Tax=Macrophomina phaseolina (strain MS6) TaxID=1126212 RepID=K2S8W9_MACPH|nr:Chorismate synthase [Macrophomina phaseolina MS6]